MRTGHGDWRKLEQRILGGQFPADGHRDGCVSDQRKITPVLLEAADGQHRNTRTFLTLILRG
jgi:hypothetical protein